MIPLRYRLHCNSSRSAIQDDRAAAPFQGGRWNEDNWNKGFDCWIEMWNAFVGVAFVYRKGSQAQSETRVYEYVIDGFNLNSTKQGYPPGLCYMLKGVKATGIPPSSVQYTR
jgi:hypothetical protein